VRRVKGWRLH